MNKKYGIVVLVVVCLLGLFGWYKFKHRNDTTVRNESVTYSPLTFNVKEEYARDEYKTMQNEKNIKVFVSEEKALQRYKERCKNLISYLKDRYGLPELTKETQLRYSQAIGNAMNTSNVKTGQSEVDLSILFLGILEN